MTETFFKYSKKVLTIDEIHTGWLIDYLRRQSQVKNSLVVGYFNQETAKINSYSRKEKLV